MRVVVPCFGRLQALSFATGSALALVLACGGSSGAGLFSSEGGGSSIFTGGVMGRGGALSTGGSENPISTGGTEFSSGGQSAASGGASASGAGAITGGVAAGGSTGGKSGAGAASGGTLGGSPAAGGAATGGADASGGKTAGGVASGGVPSGGAGAGPGGGAGGVNTGGVPSGGSGGATGGCSGKQAERCDGIDNDCNSKVDEMMACPAKCTGFALDGHGYMVCNVEQNHNKASALCEEQGMRLAWIESASENAALVEFISGLDSSGRGGGIAEVTIGASDAANEGQWQWVDGGSAFWEGGAKGSAVNGAYVNWGERRPNNTSDEFAGEDCAVLVIDQPDDGEPGQWNDVACSNTYGVLCEAP